MKILVAPDSFKGSIPAVRFCEIAAKAITGAAPGAEVVAIPLADGGEGTVDSILYALGGNRVVATVLDPLGNEIEAGYGLIDSGACAVIEVAAASGLPLVPEQARNPLYATSVGTGQLIRDALERGCRRVIIGLGGSATNDGGAGALQALGYELRDWKGRTVGYGAKGLLRLHEIRAHAAHPAIAETEFILAADVDNPLLGPQGATAIFGPQKGARPEMLPKLERGLELWAQALRGVTGVDVSRTPGGGAAGGMGAGFAALLGADLRTGFAVMDELMGLGRRFDEHAFDLVITGEGQFSAQSLRGKLPVSLAQLASRHGVPVVGISGDSGDIDEALRNAGINCLASIIDRPMSLGEAMNNAEAMVSRAIFRLMSTLVTGAQIGDRLVAAGRAGNLPERKQ